MSMRTLIGDGRMERASSVDRKRIRQASPYSFKRVLAGRGRVFTPAIIDQVRRLASEGRSSLEIAAVIGSTPASVRVKCSELQIKLKRRVDDETAEVRRERLTVYLHKEGYVAFNRTAARLKESPVALAERLLAAIVDGNLYAAVLDSD